jgi:hypothetical protein
MSSADKAASDDQTDFHVARRAMAAIGMTASEIAAGRKHDQGDDVKNNITN